MSDGACTSPPPKWVKSEFLNLKRVMCKRSNMAFPREHPSVCIINMTNRYQVGFQYLNQMVGRELEGFDKGPSLQ